MFTACNTVPAERYYSYASVKAMDPVVPPGQSRVTVAALRGLWISEDGVIYLFKDNTFQTPSLNDGKWGVYEITPILNSYLVEFFRDINLEYKESLGVRTYFLSNKVRDHLNSAFAVLSEDRKALILGDKTFYKVDI